MSRIEPLGTNIVFEPVTGNEGSSGGIIIPDSVGPTQALGRVIAYPSTIDFDKLFPQIKTGTRFYYKVREAISLGHYFAIDAVYVLAVELPE